jgi:hypothetical protein
VIARERHLSDDRLVECYFAGALGDPMEPAAAEHLAVCEECGTRARALSSVLNELRADAHAATNEVFTTDRLREQHDHILRRLEHMNRPARVLSFPGRVKRRISNGARRVTPRWLAAAAAAGLFVGAVGGRLLPGMRALPGMYTASGRSVAVGPRSTAPRASTAPVVHAVMPAGMVDAFDDATFLKELELALAQTHPRELQPFDALTPHVRAAQVR